MIRGIRAIVFDIYGTLLLGPPGRVRPDPGADPKLRAVLESLGHSAPASPSTELARLVDLHHTRSAGRYPEIDLRVLWRELLDLPPDEPTEHLVAAIESVWHPATWMTGAPEMLRHLYHSKITLGLLSNAQCHTLGSLEDCESFFAGDLILLSYQHGMAKPSAALFQLMADRLACRSIAPGETLYIGNDPALDIVPAIAAGFRTALFAGHPSSSRPGHCAPDFILKHWDQLARS